MSDNNTTQHYELFLNGQLLDGIESSNIVLESSVKNISEPAQLNGTSSMDFIVYGTKKNNKILQHLYEINGQFTFNPNESKSAELRINGITVLVGNLQVNSIAENQVTGGDLEIEYNCTLWRRKKFI